MQDGQNIQDPGKLTDADKASLDATVKKMIATGESDDTIEFYIDQFTKKHNAALATSFDPHKRIEQPQAKESTNIKGSIPASQDLADTGTGLDTVENKFKKASDHAAFRLRQELQYNNDIIPKAIAFKKLQLDFSSAQPGNTDQPLTPSSIKGLALEDHPQYQPPTPEEVEEYAKEKDQSPESQKAFLNNVMRFKPEKAPAIMQHLYMFDRSNSDYQGENNQAKVLHNMEAIGRGELEYRNGVLLKPENMFESILTGVGHKFDLLHDYDYIKSASQEDRIKWLEDKLAKHDPDEPVPVPNGLLAEVSQSIAGQPFGGMVAGKLASMATVAGGAPEAAPFVNKAVTTYLTGKDFQKLAKAQSYPSIYAEVKREHPEFSNEQAEELADKQSEDESNIEAVTGGLMMLAGGEIGKIKIPTEGFKAALGTAAKAVGEAGAVSAASAAGKNFEDQLAKERGITRLNNEDELKGRVLSTGLLTLGFGLLAKGGEKIGGPTRQKITQTLSEQPPEVIQQIVGELIHNKQITPEEGNQALHTIDEHRALDATIHPGVTDENRLKIQRRILKRNALEEEQDARDKAYKPEIKEKIDKINEEIVQLSKEKKTPEEEPESSPLKNIQNAVQEQITTTPDVRSPSSDSEAMGGRNESEGPVDQETPGKGKIIEVRHGLTAEDKANVVSGQNDIALDKEEKQKIGKLAEELKDEGIAKVISSDVQRSKETAKQLADRLNLPHETDPRLNAWDVGDWQGTKDEDWKKAKEYFVNNPDATEYKGKKIGESFNNFMDRVQQARNDIETNAKDKTLLVNHSDNIMLNDAIEKNNGWNEQAKKDYLNAESPEPATVHQMGAPFVKEFVEQDIKPVANKLKMSAASFIRFMVNGLSPKTGVAEKAISDIAGALGDRNEARAFINKAIGSYEKLFERMPEKDRIEFIDRAKRGAKQPVELEDIAKAISKLDKELYDEVKKYNPNINWKDNHFRVLWKVIPGTQKQSMWSALTRRPWSGSKGFFKMATLADMSEGIKKGGVPQSTNPITMFKLAYADAMKYVTAQKAWKALKQDGFVKFVKMGEKTPEGMVKLNDNIANVYFPVKEGLVHAGHYVVDEGAGRLLNNFLSPDNLRKYEFGKGLMDIKNLYTQVELGFSGFHAIAEGLEVTSSQIGLGLRKIYNLGYNRGQLKDAVSGVKDILTSPASALTTYRAGRAAIRLAEEKDFENSDFGKAFLRKVPAAKQYLHDFFQGGGITSQHEELKSSTIKAFREAANKNNMIGAAVRALPSINEWLTNPLFDKIIPAWKVGLFMKEWPTLLKENERSLQLGTKTRNALARKLVDSIDNRLGELNYDNLYWDRTFKSAMQLMFRSVTWKLGNIRQMFGVAPEQLAESVHAAQEGRPMNLTPKTAWLLGLAVLQTGLASALQKMFAGKDLESGKDLIAPRINPNDDDERIVLPTYAKDMMHLAHDPKGYVTTSMSGIMSKVYDVWKNRDFYNYEIYDPHEGLGSKIKDIAEYLAPQPFSVSSGVQMLQKGEGGKAAMSLLGLTKAPGYLTHSEIQNEIFDTYNKRNSGVKPKDAKAGEDKKKEIRELYRSGKKDEAEEKAHEAIQEGSLRSTQIKNLFQKVHNTSDPSIFFFKQLPFEDKRYLLDKMTEEEKKIYDPSGKLRHQIEEMGKPKE